MRSDVKWRIGAWIALTLFSGIFIWKNGINMGLDLVGGMHLVLEVDTRAVLQRELTKIKTEGLEALANGKVPPKSASATANEVVFTFADHTQYEEGQKILNKTFGAHESSFNATALSATYRLKEAERQAISDNALTQTLETIRNRVDQFGTREPIIQRQGLSGTRILIQLPQINDVERAKAIIGKTALLEFKIVKGSGQTEKEALAQVGGKIPEGMEILPGVKKTGAGTESDWFYLAEKDSPVTGADLEEATIGQDEHGLPSVNYKLNAIGGKRMRVFSKKNLKNQMAIILDGKVQSAPVIQDTLERNIQISGSFSMEEAKDLAMILRAGALPAPVTYLEERTVGASLGQDSVNKSRNAMIAGALAVLAFMLFYYRYSGLLADLSQFFIIFWVFGLMAMFDSTFSLPGFAAIILTIGISVDANVLVYERIREEMRNRKTIRTAIETGFFHASRTILDANVTTFIAGAVLLQFGTGPVRGFAVTLCIGIVATVVGCLVVCRAMFDLSNQANIIKEINYVEILHKTNIDFLKPMKYTIAGSIVLISLGMLGGLTFSKPNYGIDFTGGGLFELHFDKEVTVQEVRSSLEAMGFGDAIIQAIGGTSFVASSESSKEILVRKEINPDQVTETAKKINAALKSKWPGASIQRQESVGPQVGADLKLQAVYSVLAALVGILIYVAMRFEFRYALGAVVATAHDALITLGLIYLFHIEFSTTVVAAILTVIGYSMNDTIVVFDRIRENRRLMKKASLYEVMNASVNQTLSRTLLTSGATFVTDFMLLIFGGATIRPFAWVMAFGIVFGTYSSVYIASPVVLLFERFLKAPSAASASNVVVQTAARPSQKGGKKEKLTTAKKK